MGRELSRVPSGGEAFNMQCRFHCSSSKSSVSTTAGLPCRQRGQFHGRGEWNSSGTKEMEGQVGTERGKNKNLYLKDTVIRTETHCREGPAVWVQLIHVHHQKSEGQDGGCLSPPLSQGPGVSTEQRLFGLNFTSLRKNLSFRNKHLQSNHRQQSLKFSSLPDEWLDVSALDPPSPWLTAPLGEFWS